MKRYVLIVLAALMVVSTYAQNATETAQLNKKNGTHIIKVGETEITYNLHNGKLNGEYKQVEANEVETSGFIVNDKEHSQWTSYYPDGKKWADVGFRNGKKHGVWRVWNKDGSLQFEYEYDNGTPVGTWKEYDSNGEVIAFAQK